MGGASADTVRHWCRHQWNRLNAPCVADTVVPDATIPLSKPRSSHSSSQPSSVKLPHDPPEAVNSDGSTSINQMQKPNKRRTKNENEVEFFTDYGDATRYRLQEVIGKGSYGVVCSAIDTHTGERVAIKKITSIFENVSDATRILREIRLLRLLRHSDIVDLKHIMLPPFPKHFKDIYVVFELMESDLHEVIKANRDLTQQHCRFFLYQLLRALKYIHTANVFHRDLKPKNVLANADCKLKICDFGLARVALNDAPSAIFWTDYVATRWYRAPELCGSFFSTYTSAVDIWSIGCIFAEVLLGKPLFPGKNVVHQLELITDLLGTPSPEAVKKICNEKARCCLASMPNKAPVAFATKFPSADPAALSLLERLLAFDPKDRPSAEEALADPYFTGMARLSREPSAQPLTKLEFGFEQRKMSKEDVRELIYREILEYHPQMLKTYLLRGKGSGRFAYLSSGDFCNRRLSDFQGTCSKGMSSFSVENGGASISRKKVSDFREDGSCANEVGEKRCEVGAVGSAVKSSFKTAQKGGAMGEVTYSRSLFKSASVNGSNTACARNSLVQCHAGSSNQEIPTHEPGKMQGKSQIFSFNLGKTIQAVRNGLTHS
ncbi:hypothetical protein GOP47_0012544 [Adiantum capillus-veneris]|uniref:mitogen-activated protein kinase n=1 Tax=Adiantum capillus-veneris TaxID=13818 RepID=A0A9D4US92_ADICA|nr:hypothetical protein GOP47_0012544 [Adiantum capillus-veneris]